jgi:hypothetical protein
MRCSILSSFFNNNSFAPSSAAEAVPELTIDIAVAASKTDLLQYRRRASRDVNGPAETPDDM